MSTAAVMRVKISSISIILIIILRINGKSLFDLSALSLYRSRGNTITVYLILNR